MQSALWWQLRRVAQTEDAEIADKRQSDVNEAGQDMHDVEVERPTDQTMGKLIKRQRSSNEESDRGEAAERLRRVEFPGNSSTQLEEVTCGKA